MVAQHPFLAGGVVLAAAVPVPALPAPPKGRHASHSVVARQGPRSRTVADGKSNFSESQVMNSRCSLVFGAYAQTVQAKKLILASLKCVVSDILPRPEAAISPA